MTSRSTEDAPVPLPFDRRWPLRYLLIPVARLLRRAYRVRVFGAEHIPLDRPVVYVGKHPRSYLYLETLVLGLVTFWDSNRRPFRVLEQSGTSLHHVPLLGWMRRHVQAIPATEVAARAALARGESLLIFPGGARELYGAPDSLRWHGRTGFARLALAAHAPIQPFAIIGADQQHPGRLRIGRTTLWLPPVPLPVAMDYHFAPSIPPDGSANSPADVATLAARAHEATSALLDAGLEMRRRHSLRLPRVARTT